MTTRLLYYIILTLLLFSLLLLSLTAPQQEHEWIEKRNVARTAFKLNPNDKAQEEDMKTASKMILEVNARRVQLIASKLADRGNKHQQQQQQQQQQHQQQQQQPPAHPPRAHAAAAGHAAAGLAGAGATAAPTTAETVAAADADAAAAAAVLEASFTAYINGIHNMKTPAHMEGAEFTRWKADLIEYLIAIPLYSWQEQDMVLFTWRMQERCQGLIAARAAAADAAAAAAPAPAAVHVGAHHAGAHHHAAGAAAAAGAAGSAAKPKPKPATKALPAIWPLHALEHVDCSLYDKASIDTLFELQLDLPQSEFHNIFCGLATQKAIKAVLGYNVMLDGPAITIGPNAALLADALLAVETAQETVTTCTATHTKALALLQRASSPEDIARRTAAVTDANAAADHARVPLVAAQHALEIAFKTKPHHAHLNRRAAPIATPIASKYTNARRAENLLVFGDSASSDGVTLLDL